MQVSLFGSASMQQIDDLHEEGQVLYEFLSTLDENQWARGNAFQKPNCQLGSSTFA